MAASQIGPTHFVHVAGELRQSMMHRGGGDDQVCKGDGLALRLLGETRDVVPHRRGWTLLSDFDDSFWIRIAALFRGR